MGKPLDIWLAPKMAELFRAQNVRYRVAYGGRAGAKSYGFADMAIARMMQRRTDLAICREYKTTIKDSVHKLLRERIDALGVNDAFECNDTSIVCRYNDSKVKYQHLHDNYTEVKGLEGTDICWMFEGHDTQKESFKILDPTIRRTPRMVQDPEFWIEFNPQFEDDFIYSHFVNHSPDNCICVKMNYLDNPRCPEDQKRQAEQCRAESEDEYQHIWLGHPRNVGGLVYTQFDPKEHIRDIDLAKIEPIGNFFMGQDPHSHYYPACVWLGRVASGDTFDYYWYNEWPTVRGMKGKFYHEIRKEEKCTMTLMQRAKIYRLLDNTVDRTYNGIEIMARGIDTRFAKGSGSASEITNTKGMIIEMADPANGELIFETPPEYMIDAQRDRIRKLLSWDKLVPMHALNRPQMYVLPHCENIIDALKYHRFNREGKDKEDEKRKDFGDAMKIALATEQQHKHIDKTRLKAHIDVVEPPDRLASLQSAFMGPGSGLHGSESANSRRATPIS